MLLRVFAIVVPVLAAIVTTFASLRLPTLERRASRHVELLSKLPDGVGAEYRASVEEELELLAGQVRLRMKNAKDYRSFRMASTYGASVFLFISCIAFLTPWIVSGPAEGATPWIQFGYMALVIVYICGAFAIGGYLWTTHRNSTLAGRELHERRSAESVESPTEVPAT